MVKQLTAIIEREGDGYVSLCPELDVASQGDSIAEARANLIEALGIMGTFWFFDIRACQQHGS